MPEIALSHYSSAVGNFGSPQICSQLSPCLRTTDDRDDIARERERESLELSIHEMFVSLSLSLSIDRWYLTDLTDGRTEMSLSLSGSSSSSSEPDRSKWQRVGQIVRLNRRKKRALTNSSNPVWQRRQQQHMPDPMSLRQPNGNPGEKAAESPFGHEYNAEGGRGRGRTGNWMYTTRHRIPVVRYGFVNTLPSPSSSSSFLLLLPFEWGFSIRGWSDSSTSQNRGRGDCLGVE